MNTTKLDLASEVPFDSIVEQSVVGIYIMQDETFVYCNEHWASILGYTVDEMQGKHLSALVPAYFLPTVLERYQKRLQGNPPSMHFITHGTHKKGHELSIEVHGTRVIFRGRPAVLGVGVDVTERLAAEEEVRKSSQLLKDLLNYTRAKLDEQRQQYSRDIHDLIGGMLTTIKLEASRIEKASESTEIAGMASNLMEITQQTIEAVRTIARDLRPSDLEHLDLAALVSRDLDAFSKRTGVKVTLQACPEPIGLSYRRATAVHRIFQEALTNIIRHAKATNVNVALSCMDEYYVMDLSDDGAGFAVETEGRKSLGLLGMHERAREVGGSLEITSQVGSGTFLRVRVPLI